MKSVYISGPYSGCTGTEEDANIFKAAKVAADYIKRGYAVFCPHTHSTLINREYNPDGMIDYDDWLTLDLYWLFRCDAVHMLPGWKNSKGAKVEYMVAKALGKLIRGEAE